MRRTSYGSPRPRRSQARSLSIIILPVLVVILAAAAVIRFDLISRLRGETPPATPTATAAIFVAQNPTATPTRIILVTARPTNTPFATVALPAAETPTAATPDTASGTPAAEATTDTPPTETPTPEPTATPTLPSATTISANAVNLRAAPSLDADVLTALDPNTTVLLLARSDDGEWWQVRVADTGLEGWMSILVLVIPELPTDTPTPTDTPAADTPTPAAIQTPDAAATAPPPVDEPPPTLSPAQPPAGEYLTRHFAISFPAPPQRLTTIANELGGRTAQGVWLIVPIRWRNTTAERLDTYVNGPSLCIVNPDTPAACLREDVLARADYFRSQGRTWFDWMTEPGASVDGWLVFDVPTSLTAPVLRIHFDAPWDAVVAEIRLE